MRSHFSTFIAHRYASIAAVFFYIAMLSGCDLSPDYTLPKISLSEAFKEDNAESKIHVEPVVTSNVIAPIADGSWKRFDKIAKLNEIAWWRMFNDPTLNALMDTAMKDNPSLVVAIERVNAARGNADETGAPLLPSVSVGFGPERLQQSSAAINANLPPNAQVRTKPYTLYTARGTITYELDVFGKNRATARAASHDAEAEQDDYLAARTALQAEVAQAYFRLVSLRDEEAAVNESLAALDEKLALTRQKQQVGEIDRVVLSEVEIALATTQSDAAIIAQSRAASEHGLAILLGIVPSALDVKTTSLAALPPQVPAGLPSSLLERRPDIKSAQRKIAAANERIGVARSGYFPDISLSASGGTVASVVEDLFKWSSRTWALGPLAGTILTQPIFEGGRLAAVRAQADANYNGAVGAYRASVLKAFGEVEDQLSSVRQNAIEVSAAKNGLNAAISTYDIAKTRFNVGTISKLEYLDAKRGWLAAKRNNTRSLGEYYIATIQLVKALGGAWQDVPQPEKISEDIAKKKAPFKKQVR